MDEKQLQECRSRLERFLKDLLEPVVRADRRQWDGAYLPGLVLDGKRLDGILLIN